MNHPSWRFRTPTAIFALVVIFVIAACSELPTGTDSEIQTPVPSAAPTEISRVADDAKPTTAVKPTAQPTSPPPTSTPLPVKTTAKSTETATPTEQPRSTPTPTAAPQPTAPPSTPTPTPTPAPMQTQVPAPPPHHYLTLPEVETALSEVDCTGWTQRTIGEITYYRVCASDDSYDVAVMGSPTNISGGKCNLESDASVRFSAAPTDLLLVRSIVPPGSPSAETIAGHSYIHNTNAMPGASMRVPVYAVADSTLNDLAYYISNDGKLNFYFLSFGVTCEIGYMYDHIVEVVPKIADVAPTTASVSSATDEASSTVTFEAGELIGYAGEGTWDFGASDTTHINQFANQSRYIGTAYQGALHQICPYDLYDDPLKSQFYSMFGDPGGTLGDVESCDPARDVLGSASGRWFDSQDYETGRQALGIAMMPADAVQMSTVSRSLRVHKDNPTWVDPELMTTSHCYADSGEWFYLEILADGMQMSLAIGDGSCPDSLPEGATIFYR